jgi:hypothetical protein
MASSGNGPRGTCGFGPYRPFGGAGCPLAVGCRAASSNVSFCSTPRFAACMPGSERTKCLPRGLRAPLPLGPCDETRQVVVECGGVPFDVPACPDFALPTGRAVLVPIILLMPNILRSAPQSAPGRKPVPERDHIFLNGSRTKCCIALTTQVWGLPAFSSIEGRPMRASVQDWVDSLRTNRRGQGAPLPTHYAVRQVGLDSGAAQGALKPRWPGFIRLLELIKGKRLVFPRCRLPALLR